MQPKSLDMDYCLFMNSLSIDQLITQGPGHRKENWDMPFRRHLDEGFSVISTITSTNFELVRVSICNTNGKIFSQFIEELCNVLEDKYGQSKTSFIIAADGARYH